MLATPSQGHLAVAEVARGWVPCRRPSGTEEARQEALHTLHRRPVRAAYMPGTVPGPGAQELSLTSESDKETESYRWVSL